jgi:hypothetical protein
MHASDLKLESSARSPESFTVFVFSPILSRSKLAGATSQVSSVCYWFSLPRQFFGQVFIFVARNFIGARVLVRTSVPTSFPAAAAIPARLGQIFAPFSVLLMAAGHPPVSTRTFVPFSSSRLARLELSPRRQAFIFAVTLFVSHWSIPVLLPPFGLAFVSSSCAAQFWFAVPLCCSLAFLF